MKLTLLEDGVLDYKGDAAVLATPNAVPTSSMGAGVKPAPKGQHSRRERFEQHIEDCPQCERKLCDMGRRLSQNL